MCYASCRNTKWKDQSFEQLKYKTPYIQTTLLIYELINLQHKIEGTNIKIKEKSGMRKDRYSSLGYNYHILRTLEKNLNTDSYSSDFSNFTPCISSISF